jgi:hypothetical protein
MTNARVESFADGVRTLNLANQLIPISTAVMRPVPVGVENVQEGKRIAASGSMGLAGVLQARLVWIPTLR